MITAFYGKKPPIPEKGAEALKIHSLFHSYGAGYDFCRFYCFNGGMLVALEKDYILYETGKLSDSDFEEIGGFLSFYGFKTLFCSERAGISLKKFLAGKYNPVNYMRFNGSPLYEDINCDPNLSEVYAVLKTGFEIEYEHWYLDISHRVRHGVSMCCMLGKSAALVVQYNIKGEALLSQIAVIPEERGKGVGERFIRSVCGLPELRNVYAICENRTLGFYLHSGFIRQERKFIILS